MTSLLFDLDGTLVDSSIGILNAFRYTFKQMEIDCPDDLILSTYIGPPLEVTFQHFFKNSSLVETAINHFRQFYKEIGVSQVTLYPEIKQLLKALEEANYDLFVTTSKHQPMAIQMLTELGITSCFKGIIGSTSQRYHKVDVIQACLSQHHISPSQAAIIGDTAFDIIGGQEAGILTVGVTWGFGNQASLIEHNAHAIIDEPLNLLPVLNSLF
ncbi:HAD hydrolase-like protein [Streptococcus ictaluri]|uniref:Haloacid dehalogenase-like hydrolase n=1 Tax=Streptococcus ictaluri 707-05 TaxID=764299 RepID=G5K0N1_9STRE|nr:HAD hydrolase-like protein [Streptococcus ictaluri]EHI70546.1 haloacid dehalogenase-like hydrolase [Streptococcus ictaluri 707-05]